MTFGRALFVSVTLIIAVRAIASISFSEFEGRWGGLESAGLFFYALCLAYVSIVLLLVAAIILRPKWIWISLAIVFCIAFPVAKHVSHTHAIAYRQDEIQAAIELGLQEDCFALLEQYDDDARTEEYGIVTIYRSDVEYDALPQSIRSLEPKYVTIEFGHRGAGIPTNVGICKDGFGGFSFGVRVFLDSDSIPETFWREEVTPNVYLWQAE